MWKCVCGEQLEDKHDTCWNCLRNKKGEKTSVTKPATKTSFTSIMNEVNDFLSDSGDFTSSRTLKDELILNEWAMIIDQASGEEVGLINDIKNNLENSSIPGDCHWSIQEVKSKGIISRVKREFLVVHLEQFSDYHMYIGVRDYGVHLDCCRFLTVEPNVFKKWTSKKLTGFIDSYSVPKNILLHQDLRAWITVVHHCVLEAVSALMKKLDQDPKLLQRGSKGYLDIW